MKEYFPGLIALLAVIGVPLIIFIVLRKKWYISVPQDSVMIIFSLGGDLKVSFADALVYPVINQKEIMKIPLISIEIDRQGENGLICSDYIRADISLVFYLRVNKTAENILRVVKMIGAKRASDPESVGFLFNAKFTEAMKTVAYKTDFITLLNDSIAFREKLLHAIGTDLNGYILEDIVIGAIGQTPESELDPTNILDAQAIKKINT